MIKHVIPVDDEIEHSTSAKEVDYPMGPWVECECGCRPRIDKNGESYICVHRSSDGREALEEASAILGLFYKSPGWLVYLT